MNKNIELLLRKIREKDVRELVENHIRDITFDETKKEVTIFIDKQYVINLIKSARYVSYFMGGPWKCFGKKSVIILRLIHPHHTHNREMLIPHVIHFSRFPSSTALR